MLSKPEAHRVASLWHTRKAINKFNAPEVLGMLFKALEAAELEDVVEQLRRLKVPQLVNDAWMHRVKVAAVKTASANVTPIRQRSQYSCMATSMTMCLKAHGVDTNEDQVNSVMGAIPMRGASWENALACAQHYGFRATLVVPSTLKQVKAWTDAGIPVMIAWNPEGRDWSHASVVFDVDDDFNVSVADPNIPDPDETVRVVTKDEFYHKWFEKWPNYLVRRPAMAVEREITAEGRQVKANQKNAIYYTRERRQEMNYGLPGVLPEPSSDDVADAAERNDRLTFTAFTLEFLKGYATVHDNDDVRTLAVQWGRKQSRRDSEFKSMIKETIDDKGIAAELVRLGEDYIKARWGGPIDRIGQRLSWAPKFMEAAKRFQAPATSPNRRGMTELETLWGPLVDEKI